MRPTSKSSHSFYPAFAGLLLASVLTLCGCHLLSAEATAAVEPTADQHQQQVVAVLKQLSDDQLWTEPARQSELIAVLDAAARLADCEFLPPLIKHIGYQAPFDPDNHGTPDIDQIHPVYPVLKRIGTPAIPALLEALSHLPVVDNEAHLAPDGGSLVYAIRAIYDLGGQGITLARTRIELALAETEDPKVKANLRAALALRIIKADTKQ